MGGFVIDTHDPTSRLNPYIPDSCRLTLTGEGLVLLAQYGFTPDISRSAIEDQSKADYLGKGLSCVQAGWLIVQCISRLGSHLPVTFLEINTLGHVLCALTMYFLWWDKPLNVLVLIPVTGKWTRSLCSLMWMCSDISASGMHGNWAAGAPGYEMDILQYRTPDSAEPMTANGSRQPQRRPSIKPSRISSRTYTYTSEKPRLTSLPPQPGPVETLRGDIALGSTGLSVNPNHKIFEGWSTVYYDECDDIDPIRDTTQQRDRETDEELLIMTPETIRTKKVLRLIGSDTKQIQWAQVLPDDTRPTTGKVRLIYRVQPVLKLDSTSVERWKLAAEELSRLSTTMTTSPHLNFPRTTVTREAANWPGEFSFSNEGYRRVLPIVLSALFTTFYGGLHGLAWNSTFPTAIEHWLWRALSLSIATSGLTFSAYLTFINFTSWSAASIKDKLDTFLVLFYLPCLAYGFARLFLVTEAFASLRTLPSKAYETPKWTNFIPHL